VHDPCCSNAPQSSFPCQWQLVGPTVDCSWSARSVSSQEPNAGTSCSELGSTSGTCYEMSDLPKLRRLVVETLVIFVGVLAAFSVDAWWDGVQQRRAAKELLESVVAELEYNLVEFEYAAERHLAIAAAGLAILKHTGPSADRSSAERVLELLPEFYLEPKTDLRTSAISTALVAGAFETLGAADLGREFDAYPGAVDLFHARENRIERSMEQRVFPRLWLHIPQMNVAIDAAESGRVLGQEFASALPERSRFDSDVRGLLGDVGFENAVVERTTLLQIAGQASLGGASRTRDLLEQVRVLTR